MPETAWVSLTEFDRTGFTYGRPPLLVGLWRLARPILFRLTPGPFLNSWRCGVLRMFGARIGRGVVIAPTVKVHFPWRLQVGRNSWIGDDVWLYNVDTIQLGDNCIISQKSILCTASHDPSHPRFRTTTQPIVIGDGAWVAMDCFIGPGVTIGANTVVGARSTVLKSLPPGKICFGHPCRVYKDRVIRDDKNEK